MMDGGGGQIRYPVETPPGPGEAVEIAPGVLWMRLPLPTVLDHVNIYALDDGDRGWTVVDTGMRTEAARTAWESLLSGPLGGRPVWRQIVTHFHPDHVGLSAWLAARGAEVWTTRTTYLLARMLVLDVEERPTPQAQAFWRDAGIDAATRAKRAGERPFNFVDVVDLLPIGYRRIKEGDRVQAGGRDWIVRTGEGHAAEQATLWSEDGALVLGADQLLPSISPNISVVPGEPDADPIAGWLESCDRLSAFATDRQLVLPGHKLPFTGLPMRLRQKADNHHGALDRLVRHLAEPRLAVDCFAPLFKREITPGIFNMALGETIAHLNHLLATGRARRWRSDEMAWLWQAGPAD